jgi:DNA invertase Pin-like site-specific DNA recombinase
MSRATVPAAAYLRKSTKGKDGDGKERQEQSLKRQWEAIQALAKREGYTVAPEHKYVDDGWSGDDPNRPAFAVMRDAALAGRFGVILAASACRITRADSLRVGVILDPFRDKGIVFHLAQEGLVDLRNRNHRVLFILNTDVGHNAYLDNMAHKVAGGMLLAARKGDWMAPAPYAFRLDRNTRRLMPGPEKEVAVVRRIFESYLRGNCSLRRIALELNRDKVPTWSEGRGRESGWSPNMVRRILTNDAYIGVTTWNKSTAAKYHRVVRGSVQEAKGGRRRATDKADRVTTEGTHPALVDKATFLAVRRLLAERRQEKSPKQGPVFVLSGLLECGLCGYTLCGRLCWPRKSYRCPECGKRHVHRLRPGVASRACPCGASFAVDEGYPDSATVQYLCEGGQQYGKCRVRSVDEVDLLHLLGEQIENLIGDPEKWRAEVVRVLRAAATADPAKIEAERAALAALEKKIRQGAENFLTAPASLTGEIAAALEAWRSERDERAEALKSSEEAAAAAGDVDEVAEHVVSAMQALRLRFISGDRDAVRSALKRVFRKVTVDFDPAAKSASVVSSYRLLYRPDAFTLRGLLPTLVQLIGPPYPYPCEPGDPESERRVAAWEAWRAGRAPDMSRLASRPSRCPAARRRRCPARCP